MTSRIFRDANAGDSPAIVDFQLAMALETEGMRLDRAVCSAGVAAVFADPAKGAIFRRGTGWANRRIANDYL